MADGNQLTQASRPQVRFSEMIDRISYPEVGCTRVYRDIAFWIFLGIVIIGVILQQVGTQSSGAWEWYSQLQLPGWTPPSYFFSIIWSIIYLLLAWSTFYAYRQAGPGIRDPAPPTTRSVLIVVFFIINIYLNILWSDLFWRQRDPRGAFWVIVILFIQTLILAWLVYRESRLAGLLFVVYLFWLIIAGILNWEIITLNPGV